FEAYHTARKRQMGVPVDDFSSIVPLHSERRGFPAGPIILIAIGALFLLNNLDILHFHQIIQYWPVALIGLGAYMLYERLTGPVAGNPEVRRGDR
ncbi:MAG: LiaI-LiaF-like domain-containing protein, partial [Bryobacteraceae bacterium]